MKRKVISALLSAAMVMSMTACGSSSADTAKDTTAEATSQNQETQTGDTQAKPEDSTQAPQIDKITMVVNGSLLRVEDGQKEFEKAWEKAIEEKMGYPIDLEIQQLDHSGYKDAVGRLFVAGDYPDVILMGADLVSQYATTGVLWDMSEAYDNAEFQSRINIPAINENAKDEQGRLYRFSPTYGNGCVTYVKQSWLDAVGMKLEDIKTFDDYYNMLLAFHNQDPEGNGINGDTYGVVAAGYLNGEAPYINYIPEFWQDAYPAILQGEDGVWYDGFQTEATKEALKRLRKGVEDGAIDPETFTASTKIAREKFFSVDQTGSSGVFTYWAGKWYQTLTDNLVKNGIDSDLVQLEPIEELEAIGGYLNREAGGWCIIDDRDGDDAREKEIFKIFIETMLDGDTFQTLWTYGVEDVHWSTKAEEFVTNPGTEKEKKYSYEDGEFHMKQMLSDSNSICRGNYIDAALVVSPLTNGYDNTTDLAVTGNEFFTSHCVDAPVTPATQGYTDMAGNIHDARMAVISKAIVDGGDVDEAMQLYVDAVGADIEKILAELNQ